MNKYTDLHVEGYERVIHCENEKAGLKAWVAIHSTKLGPALGGCRMWNYNSENDALNDALRLGKAMSYKNSLAGLDFGGGKATILGNSRTQKTEDLLEAMGECVEYLGGSYITAEDVGMTFEDMKIFRRKTSYIPSIVAGDPAPTTAKGVFFGIKAVCDFLNIDNFAGVHVALQGTGAVGSALIGHLVKAGCTVTATDVNNDALYHARDTYGINVVDPNNIYDIECDIFSPCALGGVINDDTVRRLKVKAVAGSANNQLDESRHAVDLKEKGILYAPDYAINAGGVILLAGETPDGFSQKLVDEKLSHIAPTLTKIFEQSKAENEPTDVIANRLAEERLNG